MSERGVQWSFWLEPKDSEAFDKLIADLGYQNRADWLRDMKRKTEAEHRSLKKDSV